jgi:hypothetical protein
MGPWYCNHIHIRSIVYFRILNGIATGILMDISRICYTHIAALTTGHLLHAMLW